MRLVKEKKVSIWEVQVNFNLPAGGKHTAIKYFHVLPQFAVVKWGVSLLEFGVRDFLFHQVVVQLPSFLPLHLCKLRLNAGFGCQILDDVELSQDDRYVGENIPQCN